MIEGGAIDYQVELKAKNIVFCGLPRARARFVDLGTLTKSHSAEI